jgi:DNA-binding NarL/FixJ family response regulator
MKVMILDDHALVRDALSRVLNVLVPGVVILEAADPASAFVMVEREPDIDLVLLDLTLPGMHGLRALRELRESYPAVSVVVISATVDRDAILRAIDSGALGYIPKSSSNEVLRSALQLVLSGGVYLPPEILGRSHGAPPIESSPGGHKMPSEIGLTQRQAQILAYMMRGDSNKLICRALNIAEATVKNQVTLILKALNVTSRTQAVLAVAKLGLVLPRTGQDES